MKKFLGLFLFIIADLFCQSYNGTVITSIDATTDVPQSVFSNRQGTNLVVKNSGSLKLFVISPAGSVSTPVTIESAVDAGNVTISGSNDVLYVCFTKGNIIRVKKSTDNGTNWSYITNPGGTTNATNSEVVYYQNGLHLVYELSSSIYYQQYNSSSNSWSGLKTVSGTDQGYSPRIVRSTMTADPAKVYVIFTSPVTNGYSIYAKNLNIAEGLWSQKTSLYDYNALVNVCGFGVNPNKIILHYNQYYPNDSHYDFKILSKRLPDYSFISELDYIYNQNGKTHFVLTDDDVLHSVFQWNGYYFADQPSGIIEGIVHQSYNSSDLSVSENVITSYNPNYDYINLSANANDLYFIWKAAASNYLYYRQRDAAPLAVKNLTTTTTGDPDYHPIINWQLADEADVIFNNTGIQIERRLYTIDYPQHWTDWSIVATLSGSQTNYTDNINYVGSGDRKVQYRIRKKDLQNNYSPYVLTSELHYGDALKPNGQSQLQVTTYDLEQNYPNPFNPGTTIKYKLQKDGFVTLKVYDVLGKVIKELVNEYKNAGSYSVNFDASKLSSGTYIYQLRTEDVILSKRMVLIK